MKHKLFIFVLSLSAGFFSCKKPHACECTTTITFAGKESRKSSSMEIITQETTEKQARAICESTQAQLNENFQQQLADPNVKSTSSAECALK